MMILIAVGALAFLTISTICLMKCAKKADEDIERFIKTLEKKR